jgi:hypothetical protein
MIGGPSVTSIVSVKGALVPVPLVAVIVTGVLAIVVGVPEIKPLPVLIFSPAGKPDAA